MIKLVCLFVAHLLVTILPGNASLAAQLKCSKPWTVPKIENGTAKCVCGSNFTGVVECAPDSCEIRLMYGYCMSYSDVLNTTVLGYCMSKYSSAVYEVMHVCNVSELNSVMCEGLHRTGQMCGSCDEGYTLPVYSYDLDCIECIDYRYNWLKYIAAAFLPLTVFYIVIVIFRISVMSRDMHAYVMISQIVSTPTFMRLLHLSTKFDRVGRIVFHALSTLYGVWNLDFFRSLFPPFCLHPSLATLHVLSLDYIIAVYPMFLILITYVCVVLHDHSRIVILLCSPFHRCVAKLRREWRLKQSLVDVFATFLLLSYVKILNVSCDILLPTTLFAVNGKKVQHFFLYYDGTIQYFQGAHVYFATLALTMCLIFNIIPLILLAVYPCRCFQSCLNHLQLQSQVFTHFMDAFQGNFKTQPYDCRYFAAFYLFLRMANLLILCWTRSGLYFYISTYVFTCAALVVAALRPYPKIMNTICDVVLILSISSTCLWYSIYWTTTIVDPFHHSRNTLFVIGILVLTPAAYAALHCSYRTAVPKCLVIKFTQGVLGDQYRELYQSGVDNERIPILQSVNIQ